MKIGRPIKQHMDSMKFEFPLFKMWENRLKNHFWLTTVEEARQQLDQQGIDQVSSFSYLCVLFHFFR